MKLENLNLVELDALEVKSIDGGTLPNLPLSVLFILFPELAQAYAEQAVETILSQPGVQQ